MTELSQEVFQEKFLEMHQMMATLTERLADYPEIKAQVQSHESIVKVARWSAVPILGFLHVGFKHLFGKI